MGRETYIPPLRMMPLPLTFFSHGIHERPCLLEGFEVEGALEAGAGEAEGPGVRVLGGGSCEEAD